MTEQESYEKIVEGWSGLDFPPQSQGGWSMLAVSLKNCSSSLFHAKRIVKEWCLSNSHCPKPIDLPEFSKSVPDSPEIDPHAPLPDPCEECLPYGGNYRIVEINGIEGAKRCDCRRGKMLQSLEQIRKRPPVKNKKMRKADAVDFHKSAANDTDDPGVLPW